MKAIELAEFLMMNPDADVVFDDRNTEYLYFVEVIKSKENIIKLTWDIDQGARFEDQYGQLVEP